MPPKDGEAEFVEFSHPQGHLMARVLVPSIGQSEAPVIRAEIASHLDSLGRGRLFVLDLSQVSLLSSMGLGMCVDLRNLAEKKGLRPVIFGMNRHLADLFRLMRIEHLFQQARTPQELSQLLSA